MGHVLSLFEEFAEKDGDAELSLWRLGVGYLTSGVFLVSSFVISGMEVRVGRGK